MRAQRIALVSEHASPLAALGGVDAGGQNVHVAALATALVRAGCDVSVYTRRDDVSVPDVVRTEDGYSVIHVDAGPPFPLPKDSLLPHMGKFSRFLHRAWSDQAPDIVHSHFWMSGWASLQPAMDTGVPLVQTFHALGTVKRRYQPNEDTSPPQRIAIERMVLGHCDGVIATCRDEVAELEAMGSHPGLVQVVPCGVDAERFVPSTGVRRQRRRLKVVSLGRLVPRKGIDDVIRALIDVPEAALTIAGGPEPDRLDRDAEVQRLRSIAHAVGVGNRVRFLGALPRTSVPALLRSADVVACTPWYEPFGIVPLEAGACGVPVVASAVGGLTDTVVDGRTGLLVPPRDRAAIAIALSRLAADPALRARLGHAAATRIRSKYSWAHVADRTMRVYDRLVVGTGAEAVPA